MHVAYVTSSRSVIFSTFYKVNSKFAPQALLKHLGTLETCKKHLDVPSASPCTSLVFFRL